MEYKEFRAKTVDDALVEAAKEFGVVTKDLETLIVEKGSAGFLGIGARPAVIKARVKTSVIKEAAGEAPADEVKSTTPRWDTPKADTAAKKEVEQKNDAVSEAEDEFAPSVEKVRPKSAPLTDDEKTQLIGETKEYLTKLFGAMELDVQIEIEIEDQDNVMSIDVEGPDMGVLIGKRGQTLDALQYLISLFVNKKSKDKYIRIKLDTENYRERRKETLENLAKNIAFKVKRTRRSFTLEPMNPYERRIIHSTLQNDRFVSTRSEGEEPYRRVVIFLKKKEGR